MLADHAIIGIVQIIFYAPVLASAIYLLHRHGRPRMAWILLLTYSLLRLTGGIIVILAEQDQYNVGLQVANIVLIGVGIIPLIVATMGLIRVMYDTPGFSPVSGRMVTVRKILTSSPRLATDFSEDKDAALGMRILRGICLVAVGLLIAGGSVSGSLSQQLIQAGYGVVTAILGLVILGELYLYTKWKMLSNPSKIVMRGLLAAVPFLIVRITYACLSVFQGFSVQSEWNLLYGSIAAYVIMAILMEFVVVGLYVHVGFAIPPRKQKSNRNVEDGE